MAAASSLYTASTGLCADSVESAPGCRGLFALATYQVDKHEQHQAQSETSSATVAHDEDNDEDDPDAVASTSISPAYTRRGTCSLYYAHDPSDASTGRLDCEKVDTIETPAILDMKWSLTKADDETRRILGVANAKGQVTVHRLQDGTSKGSSRARLSPLGELHFNDRNALCLSLDFSDRKGGHAGGYDMNNLTADTAMIVSQSDGSLAYLPSLEAALSSTTTTVNDNATEMAQSSIHNRTDEDNQDDDDDEWERTSEDERLASLQIAHSTLNSSHPNKPRGLVTWAAHDFEAWIAAFDCFNPTTVWSGGDDLTLKGWDVRSVSSTTPTSPTFACTKPFNGGVTSLQSHHLRQHLWAVGSYDSHLRLFDARMPARPLSETNVGGGVWRVKWHPDDPQTLLVGCMHDGFKVLRLDDLAEEGAGGAGLRGKEFDVVTRFDAHESLAYGCDWDRGEVDAEGAARRVYSCSFYDATLHIWDSQDA
ncbi:Diphthine methyltransferase [Pseudozyma hubeiensis]|nr:Diphthine methyltransferase [Pseudozyma hubeiensis]